MNKLEKQLFYKFLLLYIISATLFLLFSAFWYFTAQKNMITNMVHTKMDSLANEISSYVINANTKNKEFKYNLNNLPCKVILFDKDKNVVYGIKPKIEIDWSKKFYKKDDCDILISDKTYDHLGVKYIVIVDENIKRQIDTLKIDIALYVFVAFIFISLIGYLLSKLFLKPIRLKMKQIDEFIKDTTHELNTPVTALMMSVNGLVKEKVYNEKLIRNIKISSTQLKDIYSSLVFVNFNSHQSFEEEDLCIGAVLENSIKYFTELSEAKRIEITLKSNKFPFSANRFKMEKLFNNLISNAIKYSSPKSKIKIEINDKTVIIEDEGIGIAKEDLKSIYKRYNRATKDSGGFGIGLNIVWMIAQEYDIAVDISSELKVGTKVTLDF